MINRADADAATRTRILEATFDVLGRHGYTKLNLSDVAARARVSRPTLYKMFSSKSDLLEAFGQYEQQKMDDALASAIDGHAGRKRLDAALKFIVAFENSYSLRRMVEVEPDHVLWEISRVLPILRERIQPLIQGKNAEVTAAAIVRIAVSHYLVRGDDEEQFLAQLRRAAGLAGPVG